MTLSTKLEQIQQDIKNNEIELAYALKSHKRTQLAVLSLAEDIKRRQVEESKDAKLNT